MPTGARIRATVAAAILLAVVAALFAQDRPGAPRMVPAGPVAASYLATQLATLGYGPAGDNGTYFSDEFQQDWNYAGAVQDMRLLAELGWRLATDSAMAAYNPNEQFARPRQ